MKIFYVGNIIRMLISFLILDSAKAELNHVLKTAIEESDLVFLACSGGKSIVILKGERISLKSLSKQADHVLLVASRFATPSLTIKKKGAINYSNYLIRDGAIKVNKESVKVHDILKHFDVNPKVVGEVFLDGEANK